jgi:hypothetical protein
MSSQVLQASGSGHQMRMTWHQLQTKAHARLQLDTAIIVQATQRTYDLLHCLFPRGIVLVDHDDRASMFSECVRSCPADARTPSSH